MASGARRSATQMILGPKRSGTSHWIVARHQQISPPTNGGGSRKQQTRTRLRRVSPEKRKNNKMKMQSTIKISAVGTKAFRLAGLAGLLAVAGSLPAAERSRYEVTDLTNFDC